MSHDIQNLLFGTEEKKLLVHMEKYNITKRMLDESIQQIRSWFELQPHMPKIDLEDRFLIGMLASNAYSIEKSKEKLENFFTAKSIMPEFFRDRDTSGATFLHSKKIGEWVIIPKADKYRVIIYTFNENYINEYHPVSASIIGAMGAEMRLYYETTFDTVLIFDCANMKFGHAVKLPPSSMAKSLFLFQKCFSAKLTNIHAVNAPHYAAKMMTFIKTILKKKLADRVFTHENAKGLHEHVDLEYLPNELGGTAGTYSEISGLFYKSLQSDIWRKRLMESVHKKTDESKRLESTKGIFDSHLGIEGSFRKLDID